MCQFHSIIKIKALFFYFYYKLRILLDWLVHRLWKPREYSSSLVYFYGNYEPPKLIILNRFQISQFPAFPLNVLVQASSNVAYWMPVKKNIRVEIFEERKYYISIPCLPGNFLSVTVLMQLCIWQ